MVKIIILLLNIISILSIQTKIFTTPIFSFLPKLKLHHIVLVSKNDDTNKNFFASIDNIINDVYIIDYTPVENINFKNAVKLFLGGMIKGKIRIIHMNSVNKNTLIDEWYEKTKLDKLDKLDKLNKLDKLDKIIENWNTDFNIYNHNCQHFGKYLIKELNQNQ